MRSIVRFLIGFFGYSPAPAAWDWSALDKLFTVRGILGFVRGFFSLETPEQRAARKYFDDFVNAGTYQDRQDRRPTTS